MEIEEGAEQEFWRLEKKGEMRAESMEPKMRVNRRGRNQIREERCF